jgi:hypothetical protein
MVSSIVDLHQQYGDQLVVIGVDSAEDLEVVRAFVDEQDMTYLNLIGDVKTMQAYRLRAHPFLVLVTPEGQMFRTYLGYTDRAIIEQDVRVLLGLE